MKWYWWLLPGSVITGILIYRQRVVSNLKNMKLSENFSLSEFVVTATGLDNIPGDAEVKRLQLLVTNILQPLRKYLNRPVHINSGYRSPLVNKAIGGSSTSQHMKGEAADIRIDGMTNQEIVSAIRTLNLPYDQLIDEQLHGSKWVHVSYSSTGGRKQWLTARDGEGGKTVYETVKFG